MNDSYKEEGTPYVYYAEENIVSMRIQKIAAINKVAPTATLVFDLHSGPLELCILTCKSIPTIP